MTDGTPMLPGRLEASLRRDGFAFVPRGEMLPRLEQYGLRDWASFAGSWNRLGLDRYMADGGRYRRRRHATFAISARGIQRKKHQPHYQSRDYNELNGGIERWFRAVEPEMGEHPALRAILRLMHRIVTDMSDPAHVPDVWHTEVHQFRIEALDSTPGQPTPEGLHRDGVDWVMVVMVRRENVMSGETTIHDLQRTMVGGFMLDQPLDTAVVNDNRVYHGVTAVRSLDPTRPAYRDVLVVTFRHQ
ncbi:hypothetical protein CFR78_07770 [Komagataeibacter rhaeticus]|uniref:2OG-Fe dioxygenase family protein n=1 Tax=Komagataeibacter rhaeticus TaxID=215221 RepID=UPI0004D91A9D|nr:2OG-Fe dioxygenase family protein [Komagataeibacter rhaeticus]KDU96872.1 hypothetical protein GLUCORHAEAF1_18065 [Komagataeibacter rhaeticus AF1]MBL7240613.1 2OG-Fe dioxygenase family protein [Komagataeibacter rhaeticus]PYD53899.1 hypothetical protein CFR78_07770 [Komagataeibacter rhaeticus]